jgi:hypothetical protein
VDDARIVSHRKARSAGEENIQHACQQIVRAIRSTGQGRCAHPVLAVVPLAKTISPPYFFAAFPAMFSGLASPEKRAEARLSGIAQGWPSDLPVEQASKYDLVLNLKTANQ